MRYGEVILEKDGRQSHALNLRQKCVRCMTERFENLLPVRTTILTEKWSHPPVQPTVLGPQDFPLENN